jgi:hypothetical protein
VRFFDISVQKTYFIELKVVREELTTFLQLDSKYGWSILGKKGCESKPALVLYNPFTNETIQLPQFNSSTNSVRKATFTSPPTCPDCVVLVLCEEEEEEEEEGCIIGTCKPGDKIWRFRKTGGFKDWDAVKNVTYLNGIFCFLIRKYQPWSVVLGTLDVALEEDSVDMDCTSITVVQEEYMYAEDLLLVESDGELLLAVIRTYGGVKPSYWNVYRFDWSRKDWTRVLGLGNQVLIFRQWWFNSSVSIACPTSGEESKFANMIFCHGVGGTHSFTCTSQDGVWIKKL